MICLYIVVRMCFLCGMLFCDRVLMRFIFLCAADVIFCMWGVKVKCVSKVMPRILGVLFSGMGVPLRSTCG